MAVQVPERQFDGNIDKKVDEHLNRLDDQGVKFSGVSVNGGTVSYFEHEDEGMILTKSQKREMRRILQKGPQLPAAYKSPFRRGFADYLKKGIQSPTEFQKLVNEAAEQWRGFGDVTKADAYNRIDSDSAGALVLPEFAPSIAEIPYDEMDLWQQADHYSVSGSGLKLPRSPGRSRRDGQRHGGITAGWPDEGDEIGTTRGRVESTELSLKKVAVVVFYTQELLDDESYALESWVTKSVRSEFRFLINDAMMNGTGGGMPLGYLQSGACSKVDRLTTGTVSPEDILNMYSRRRPGVAISEYQWLINQEVEVDLQLMALPSGPGAPQVVFIPPGGGLSQSPYATLMGLPLRSCEFSQARGAIGDIALVRTKGYVTISKGGINETPSSHIGFLRDQEAVKFTQRVDGRPMYDSPTTAYRGTTGYEHADFIALDV